MMYGNCELKLKQVLVWASSCNMNSSINQLFPFSSLFRKYDKKGDEPAGAR